MESKSLAHLLTLGWDKRQILDWLKEDIPSFDYGGMIVGDKLSEAILYCRAVIIHGNLKNYRQERWCHCRVAFL
jgi:hypothetical protein